MLAGSMERNDVRYEQELKKYTAVLVFDSRLAPLCYRRTMCVCYYSLYDNF
jgi:hypothetical protein